MGPGTRSLLLTAGLAAGATLVVDQATKAAARSALDPYEVHPLAFDGAIAVSHVPNHGSAYGMIPRMPTAVPAFGTAALAAGLLAGGARIGADSHALGIGVGLLVGGGAGNVIDRIRQGYVTDLLHTTDAFAHYNVADVGIVAGAAIAAAAVALPLLRR